MEHLYDFMRNHSLHFASTVPDYLTCTICRNVLIDSRFAPCGCKFCLNCITQYLLNGCKPCPSGKEECVDVLLDLDMNITKDSASDALISNLTVCCQHENCDHQCRLKLMLDHVNLCSCRLTECEFNVVGCKEKVSGGSAMSNHLLTDNVDHMRLLLGYLRKMDNKFRHKIDTMELRLEETGEKNEEFVREWQAEKNEILTSLREMKEEIDEMKTVEQHAANEVQRIVRTNEELEKKMKENAENVAKKMTEIEDKLKSIQNQQKKMKKSQGAIINGQQLEGIKQVLRNEMELMQDRVLNNEFVWKVDGLTDKRQDAANGRNEQVHSEYFESHHNGYRLRLRIYPNGNADSKGTHLSLYFIICKGPFDNVLPWPMNKKVRLAILNQKTRQDHVSSIYSYDVNKEQFAHYYLKPNDYTDQGLGSRRFISWENLHENDDVLLVNDVLFIKCSFTG